MLLAWLVDILSSKIVTGRSTIKLKWNDFPLRCVATAFISLPKTRPNRCESTLDRTGPGGSFRPTDDGQIRLRVPENSSPTDRWTGPDVVCRRSVQLWTDFYPLLD